MFSGIIDAIGTVSDWQPSPAGRTLTIAAPGYWEGVRPGASIAIDGVCLTVTSMNGHQAVFDVVTETLRRSTLRELRLGAPVNLQKALAAGDRIDGHFVQGHIDAIGTIARIDQAGGESRWWLATEAEAMSCIVPKGSIALDGISLTVAEVRDGLFSVALIPTTLQATTLDGKKIGQHVNLETDILARTVVHYLRTLGEWKGAAPSLTLDTLREQGFL